MNAQPRSVRHWVGVRLRAASAINALNESTAMMANERGRAKNHVRCGAAWVIGGLRFSRLTALKQRRHGTDTDDAEIDRAVDKAQRQRDRGLVVDQRRLTHPFQIIGQAGGGAVADDPA